MEDREFNRICEYERIRILYLSKSIRNLILCLSKKQSDEEFEQNKKDILNLVAEIY